jgi:membrane-associated phospholipid phosphatase
MRQLTACCSFVLITTLLAGCGTLANGRRWGQDVTLAPGWEHLRTSAVQAAEDPWVWMPLTGAALTKIDHWDRNISTWARRDNPVFGSQARATSWSNDLRSIAVGADVATVLLTPSGEQSGEWALDKAKGYAVDLVAATAAIESTTLIKDAIHRMRPNGSGEDSFPSGHAAAAAVYTRLAMLNMDEVEFAPVVRSTVGIALQAVNVGTAWARIEGGWHYPSDTLFSMALANFCARFFNDAFLGLNTPRTRLSLAPFAGGALLSWQMSLGP